ncbi:ArsA-related P-loop ATPase [Halobacillus litoralis]|uniref:ArsA-related P-loop ATPase n=1 Tax=Halobacillus litoralis TaxID=45668 RepID=UPI002493B7E5|nr:ArsA-related P-loop ATPase [Halobacillus litoralis]
MRSWFTGKHGKETAHTHEADAEVFKMDDVIGDLSEKGNGLVFTMGKGGVGKTTVAASVALNLVEQGYSVHLTTTDPAEHLSRLFTENHSDLLRVTNIDPKRETEAYRESVLEETSHELNEDELNYLKEDLDSPCTEEIAVFRSFADVVMHSEEDYIVIDTAPTGHTLLLLDSTLSYHREIERSAGHVPESVKNLLPALKDAEKTHILIVTLPEATPVYEAERLESDLKRADLHPKWWIMNQSLSVVPVSDPVLKAKAQVENKWVQRTVTHASKVAIIPWKKQAILNKKQR